LRDLSKLEEEFKVVSLTKVSDPTLTAKLAFSFSEIVRQKGSVQIQTVGENAFNQVEKALTLARKYLQADNIDIVYFSDFFAVEINGKIHTAIRFTVKQRK
jgi:stage V sporulation protein S